MSEPSDNGWLRRGLKLQRSLAILLGGVLLCASLLKLWSQTRHPLQSDLSWTDAAAIVDSVVVLEATFGTVLIAGWWPRKAWYVSLLIFGLFSIISGVEAVNGRSSCGCFGAAAIRPIYTVCFDLAAVALLLGTGRPDREVRGLEVGGRGSARVARRRFVAGGMALVWVAAVVGFWITRPTIAMAVGQDFGKSGELVVLEPVRWAGQRFTLAEHIDVGSPLNSGRWIVLLVHNDCDDCAAAVPRYVAACGREPRLAVIEMPPFGDAVDPPPWQLPSFVLSGRLDQSRDWFATTPVALLVKDGIVISGKDGDSAETPDLTWLR
jgi:hypothetical protein